MPPQHKDPFEVLHEAASAQIRGYENSEQMLDDFKSVFFATPAGKRVFNQIMFWAGPYRTSVVKGDPYATHVREGERNISARIWSACVQEYIERPTQTAKGLRHGRRS